MEDRTQRRLHKDLLEIFLDPEALYRTLFEHGNDGVFVYFTQSDGMPGTFVEVNARACALLGYTRDELLARGPRDLVVPERWGEIPDIVSRKQDAGGRLVFETTLRTKDGGLLEVEISDHSFERDERWITVSIVRDRTEAKNAERQRARAVTVFTNTLNSITDFVSVHDKEFRVVTANKALTEFLGMDQEAIAGTFCHELFHGNDGHLPGCPHVMTITTGKPATLVVEDSRIGVPLEITCSPYFDEKGELLGSVHIARDLSGLHSAAREKDRLIAELKLALGDVKRLSGLLPVCCQCKKIRDDVGNWQRMEDYITENSEALFSHGYCPECRDEAIDGLKSLKRPDEGPGT